MKAIDLLTGNGELAHKLRTASDLIRHVETRTEKTSNYSLLLGAGASVTSGIRSASSLIEKWLEEVYEIYEDTAPESFKDAKEYFEKKHASWYNPSNPYSSLFEKRYDLPSQRRRFVEQEVDNKLPSIGYTYVTSLVDNHYINTIFTTNFDDLLNEAFYQFSNNRPILCAHDSAISSISVTSNRPKVIKLHGDYLFDDIKSTLRETESLEQNTKEKLVEFCKEFGLIVIGYSGNDRSIMDVLEYLTKQDNYLKNGVYWCLRKDDEISPSLRNLLWKDKVYPVLIDGFDEFMAKAHSKLINRGLEVESNLNHSKLQSTIKYILEDKYSLSNNAVIKAEIDNLKNNNSSHEISGFLQILSGEKENEKIDSEHSLSDTRNFLEIDTLINKREFKTALTQCEQYFYRSEKPNTKASYIKKIIQICKFNDDYNLALIWADRLLEVDPYDSGHVLLKASCIEVTNNRFRYLSDNLAINKYSYRVLNAVSREGLALLKSNPDSNDVESKKILGYLESSINLDSSLDNSAWELKYFVLSYVLNAMGNTDSVNKEEKNERSKVKDEIKGLLEKINAIDPTHTRAIGLTSRETIQSKSYSETIVFIKKLYSTHQTAQLEDKVFIDRVLSRLVANIPALKDKDKLSYKKIMSDFFNDHYDDNDQTRNHKLQIRKARFLIGQNRDFDGARKIIDSLLPQRKVIYSIQNVIDIASTFDDFDYDRLVTLLDQEEHTLHKLYFHESKSYLLAAMKDYEGAIRHIEKAFESGLDLESYLTHKSYQLLQKGDYDEVLSVGGKHKDADYAPFLVNVHYAAQKVGSEKFNDVLIRNLSAQSHEIDVKICAFSILGNTQKAKVLIKEAVESDYNNYYKYQDWPVLCSKLLGEFAA